VEPDETVEAVLVLLHRVLHGDGGEGPGVPFPVARDAGGAGR
jgi:hypothetical protein